MSTGIIPRSGGGGWGNVNKGIKKKEIKNWKRKLKNYQKKD